jgi:hypothetical protein
MMGEGVASCQFTDLQVFSRRELAFSPEEDYTEISSVACASNPFQKVSHKSNPTKVSIKNVHKFSQE